MYKVFINHTKMLTKVRLINVGTIDIFLYRICDEIHTKKNFCYGYHSTPFMSQRHAPRTQGPCATLRFRQFRQGGKRDNEQNALP